MPNEPVDTEPKKPFVFPKPTLSHEEFNKRLDELLLLSKDPEYIAYIERTFAGIEEVRREIDEEMRRQLDEDEGK